MPAPGPGGSWIDDFEGNKLSSKWVATRYSQGGQNDGVWTRQVKDSKVYWKGVGGGTENGYWGEILSLPVNVGIGDIRIDAQLRVKSAVGFGQFSVGINKPSTMMTDGFNLENPGAGTLYGYGFKAGAPSFWPGFPSQGNLNTGVQDYLANTTILRQNGYMFLYFNGFYIGQGVFAGAITSVDIMAIWYQAQVSCEKWIDYIKIWPREVVK